MPDCQLFFGFPLSSSQKMALNSLNPSIRELFIQNQNSSCLQEITHEGNLYLGKFLGDMFDLASLQSMEIHIISMLKKLIPLSVHEKNVLYLIALNSYSE